MVSEKMSTKFKNNVILCLITEKDYSTAIKYLIAEEFKDSISPSQNTIVSIITDEAVKDAEVVCENIGIPFDKKEYKKFLHI